MTRKDRSDLSVLVTGAAGYIGRQTVRRLAREYRLKHLVALDVAARPELFPEAGVHALAMDIRSPELREVFRRYSVDIVVHLASIVAPERDRAFAYSVDVLGTRNVAEAALAAGVRKLIVTSSGAAYGYHPDNRAWLEEDAPLRGHPEFAYADHKRINEEILAEYREKAPQLEQLVFRPGTVLGAETDNQITALFEGPIILGIRGSDTPFVFIWDHDVVSCLLLGITTDRTGIYNLAGDGVVTMRQIAGIVGRPYLPLPVWSVRGGLFLLRKVGWTPYGPEQVDFLRYRPVLSNRRLKEEFGYRPEKTSLETFHFYLEARRRRAGGLRRGGEAAGVPGKDGCPSAAETR